MKKDKIIKSVILCMTFVFVIFFLIFTVNINILLNKNYDLVTAIKIQFYGIKEAIIGNYSKTLDVAINSNNFHKESANEYLELNYYTSNSYISSINKLLDVGYTVDDINLMYEKLDEITIQSLCYYKLIPDISRYMKISFFDKDNFYRYLDYYNGDYYTTVLYVNIGLDKEFYTDVNVVSEYSTDMLVNKYNRISGNFITEDLIKIQKKYSKGEEYFLAKSAAESFEKMCNEAWKNGIYIQISSAYRTYEEQQEIYEDYANDENKNMINYVTQPGFSEHHTGLAVDISSKNAIYFNNTKEDLWLKENAHKFGFILRYPKGKEKITGVEYESWHYRYVGYDIAEYIWKNNITFEEYYEMFLDN